KRDAGDVFPIPTAGGLITPDRTARRGSDGDGAPGATIHRPGVRPVPAARRGQPPVRGAARGRAPPRPRAGAPGRPARAGRPADVQGVRQPYLLDFGIQDRGGAGPERGTERITAPCKVRATPHSRCPSVGTAAPPCRLRSRRGST